MATYNADIRIGVVGKAQLNQLEAQFKRINKQVNELQRSVKLKGLNQRLNLDTRAALTAINQLERRIARLGRTVRVNLQTTEQARSRQGSSSSFISSGGNGNTAAAAAAAVAKTNVELAKSVATTKALETATDQYAQAVTEAVSQNDKIRDRLIEQERLRRQLARLEEATNRRLAANLFGAGTTNEEAIKRTTKELNNVRSSLRALQGRQEIYNRAVRDGVVARNEELQNLARINGQLRRNAQLEEAALQRRVKGLTIEERIARVQRGNTRARAIRRGASVGAGAALTSIPGLGGVATGALGGAAAGGPLGAAAGAAAAAITELTAAAVSYGNEAAKAAIETDLFRAALLGVVGGQEYYTALREIDGITRDFNANIIDTTQNFTKLAAATRANGVDAAETAEVYRGLAAANTALGGNAERLNGILLAAGQVFSKGKVQAEELRGQIGERLPGAFALFAKSVGLSTAELDKALEQGKISTEDFVNFTKFLYEQYKDDAAAIANSPEAAAARLEVSLKALQISVGQLLKPIRTSWLETADFIVRQLNKISNAMNRMGIQQQEDAIRRLRLLRASAVDRNDFEGAQALQKRINEARDLLNQLKYPLDGDGQPLGQKPTAATGESDADREKREKREARAEERRKREEARRQKLIDLAKSDQILAQGLLELEQRRQSLTEDQIAKNELLLQYQSDRRRIFINVLDEERRAIELRNLDLKLARELKVLQNDELDRRKEITEEGRKYLEDIYKLQVGLKGFTGELQKSNTELGVGLQLANDLGNQLTQTFGDLITSTDKWTDSLRNALGQLASLLLKAGFNALGGGDGRGLFSFLSGNLSNSTGGGSINPGDFLLPGAQRNFAGAAFPARANGGPVSRGRAYRVGEEGPEIFVPGSNGSIQQGGSPVVSNITVNITGDNEETDSTRSSELGRMIEASVVGVINRERRPGGLLTR